MNCAEFRSSIASAIERRAWPPHDIAAHLDDCRDAECHACWQDALMLDRAIRAWRRSQPAIDVADVIVAHCRDSADAGGAETGVPAPLVRASAGPCGVVRRASAVPRAAAAIAAAAVILLSALLLLPPAGNPGATRIAVQHAPRPADRNAASPAESPRNPAGSAGLAYVNYARNAAQFVTDAVVLTLGDRDEMENPTVAPIGIGWDASWSPVGDEMNAALDDLLDSLPSGTPAG